MSRRAYAAFLSVLCLSACGGSDGGGEQNEFTVNADAGQDGYVTSNGFRDTIMDIRVGDQDHLAPGRAVRGFVSFEMPQIPVGAQIDRANIRLYQQTTVGAPYDMLRTVIVDHVDYGLTLDPADYAIASLKDDIGTLSDTNIPGFRTVDVTMEVIDDFLTQRPRSQYRIRLSGPESDGDGLEDTVRFEDGDNSRGTGNVPVLIIQFSTP